MIEKIKKRTVEFREIYVPPLNLLKGLFNANVLDDDDFSFSGLRKLNFYHRMFFFEMGYPQTEIAEAFGEDQSTTSRKLSIVPQGVKIRLTEGKLGTVRVLTEDTNVSKEGFEVLLPIPPKKKGLYEPKA